MKKILISILAITAAVLTITVAVMIDRGETKHATITIGESDLYTTQDIEMAMKTVKKEFKRSFRNCTLLKLRYDENICKLEHEKWAAQYDKEEAIILISDFKTGKSGIDRSLDPQNTYKNWEWILIRDTGREWEVATWGY